MKLCQCCGATAEDSAVTCPKCGESTWKPWVTRGARADVAIVDEESAIPDSAPVVSTEAQSRFTGTPKGKRR